jgi:hypothetical protein
MEKGTWAYVQEREKDRSGLEVNWALDSRGRILTVA